MKYASDFRRIAREALKGKWILATVVTFVASFIGGLASSSANISIELPEGFLEGMDPTILGAIALILAFVGIVYAILGLIRFVIGGAASLGYSRFSLNLVDEKNATFGDLFSQFNRIDEGFIMNLLLSLYTTLWSLLFIIPGIIKSFSYAMTSYILSEHKELTPNDAITASRQIMDGNKFRLFCLNFSFLGWDLLTSVPLILSLSCLVVALAAESVAFVIISLILVLISLLVLIIGSWLVSVYRYTAQAAFYREVSANFFKEPTEAPSFSPNFEAFSWENAPKFTPVAEVPAADAPAEAPAEEAPEAPAEEAPEAPAEDIPPENEN